MGEHLCMPGAMRRYTMTRSVQSSIDIFLHALFSTPSYFLMHINTTE